MKATVQTRIFIALTVDEARDAVTCPTDLQLAVRSALYQIDGMPVSEMITPKTKLISAPRNGHKKRSRVHAPDKECPFCHEMKHPTGYGHHVKACKAKHPDTPVDGAG
jgi:hypothetical protein